MHSALRSGTSSCKTALPHLGKVYIVQGRIVQLVLTPCNDKEVANVLRGTAGHVWSKQLKGRVLFMAKVREQPAYPDTCAPKPCRTNQ